MHSPMSLICRRGLWERTQAGVARQKLLLPEVKAAISGKGPLENSSKGQLGLEEDPGRLLVPGGCPGDWQSLHMCERDRHVKLLPCTRPGWCLTVDYHSQSHLVLLTALYKREVKAEGQVACPGSHSE